MLNSTRACLQTNKTNSQTRFLGKYKHKPNLLFTADTSQRIPASRIIRWNNYSGQADALPDLQSHWGPQHKQGWHCKTPGDSTRNGKCVVQLCRACPPLLTVILRASFLFTPSCIVSAIRVEAVNSPCLKTFKMWWGTALKEICSSWFWFYFYHRGGTPSPEGPCQPQLFCDCAQGNWEEESWILRSWDRGTVVISEATSAGSCCDMPVSTAFSQGTAGLSHTLLCTKQVFLHCISPPAHQRISFHEQSLGSSFSHIFITYSKYKCEFPFSFISVSVSSSYPSVRVRKSQELQLPKT